MNAEQAADMERLAKLLDRLPERNFEMATYGDDELVLRQPNPTGLTVARAIKCDTACCVAGWAAIQNVEVWPRYNRLQERVAGRLCLSSNDFGEFYGIDSYEAGNVCLEGLLMTSTEKAAELRAIIAAHKED